MLVAQGFSQWEAAEVDICILLLKLISAIGHQDCHHQLQKNLDHCHQIIETIQIFIIVVAIIFIIITTDDMEGHTREHHHRHHHRRHHHHRH